MQCIEQVPNKDCTVFRQCSRKAKFWNYCGIHSKLHPQMSKEEIEAEEIRKEQEHNYRKDVL